MSLRDQAKSAAVGRLARV